MKKKIQIINGVNLNLLGERETEIYGNIGFESFFEKLKSMFVDLEIVYFQSNIEGEIVECLQDVNKKFDGVVLNAGGYSHTSVAIRDAVAAIDTPVVEVHISNLLKREPFRHISLISPVCKGFISGFGFDSYTLSINYFILSSQL
ncbi:MAG: type II 3-dehydroquinate dehydratase [Bacteroidales bacterium]|jgi:3-dehydroquinate dehydratase-2|nr:type II 3-dehydroquinate dehydratase [Bacteroidales bacterium]